MIVLEDGRWKIIYIEKWVQEFGNSTYPKPNIEHKIARKRAQER